MATPRSTIGGMEGIEANYTREMAGALVYTQCSVLLPSASYSIGRKRHDMRDCTRLECRETADNASRACMELRVLLELRGMEGLTAIHCNGLALRVMSNWRTPRIEWRLRDVCMGTAVAWAGKAPPGDV